MQSGTAQSADYAYFYALFFVVLVVVDPRRRAPSKARSTPRSATSCCRRSSSELGRLARVGSTILFGLGAITYARHPEGMLEDQKRQVDRLRPAPARPVRQAACRRSATAPACARAIDAVARRTGSTARAARACSTPDRVTKHFSGITALDYGHARVEAGESVGPHRAQRGGQDDVLQLPARPPAARRRHGRVRRPRHHPVPGLPAGAAGFGRTFQRIELFAGHDRARAPARGRAGPAADRAALEGRRRPRSPDAPTEPSARDAHARAARARRRRRRSRSRR